MKRLFLLVFIMVIGLKVSSCKDKKVDNNEQDAGEAGCEDECDDTDWHH